MHDTNRPRAKGSMPQFAWGVLAGLLLLVFCMGYVWYAMHIIVYVQEVISNWLFCVTWPDGMLPRGGWDWDRVVF
jgi:hypothetical protein